MHLFLTFSPEKPCHMCLSLLSLKPVTFFVVVVSLHFIPFTHSPNELEASVFSSCLDNDVGEIFYM